MPAKSSEVEDKVVRGKIKKPSHHFRDLGVVFPPCPPLSQRVSGGLVWKVKNFPDEAAFQALQA